MLIGILSDTHGRAKDVDRAADILRQRSAEHVCVCGDIGSPDILACLRGLPATFVWGNADADRPLLARCAAALGLVCLGDGGTIDLDGRRIGLTHGHDDRIVRSLLADGRIDYLLVGHTHRCEDRREGPVRIINPGCAAQSLAILDTRADRVEFVRMAQRGR